MGIIYVTFVFFSWYDGSDVSKIAVFRRFHVRRTFLRLYRGHDNGLPPFLIYFLSIQFGSFSIHQNKEKHKLVLTGGTNKTAESLTTHPTLRVAVWYLSLFRIGV